MSGVCRVFTGSVCVCVFSLRRAGEFPARVLLSAVDDLQERFPAAGRLGPHV